MPDFLHGVEIVEMEGGPRTIALSASSVVGVVGTAPEADEAAFPLNEPVLVAGSRTKAAQLGTEGTLPDALEDILSVTGALVVVVRVQEGLDDAETRSNVIGGVDAETDQYQGITALLAAKSQLGVTPRILIATGFTHQRDDDPENPGQFLANPVAAELISAAGRLRGIVVIDGPNTTDADALAARSDFSSRRGFFHDPWYRVWDTELNMAVTRPSSARLAGVIAWNDNNRGWWTSPSNQAVPGIVGLSRDIDFTMGDPNCRANRLNADEIATTIQEDGYRLWGNRTTSDDPKWAFLAHVRTADIINDSIVTAHRWAVDRNITKTYLEDVVGGVQTFINRQVALGRIAGGTCWADPDLNSPEDVAAGRAVFDFDFSPFGVAERLTFRSAMVNDYLEEIL
ncbi:phage tail protein [Natronospirillum operosum]|uniref:Phage tail protein n=1 Tax=Natronospirillum operosum TaxID=2759953 RepID=A0A4Z0W616_9GAMM|nr:phage tail sheath subtilisin-like domain-containing protein [Natronospirillum operosum]TGG92530.1 phage tail protein [Natronospirillum operosum]